MTPSAASDLRWVLARSHERAAALYAEEELCLHDLLLALDDAPLGTWARLARRRHPVQRRADAGEHADLLEAQGLIDGDVDWPTRAQRSTVEELKAGCRLLGRSTRGRRDALEERLRDQVDWSTTPWIRIRHRALLQRWDRLAFLERRPDPARLVVERLGHVQWPPYAPERAGPLFPDRATLLRWEAVLDRLETLDAGEPVELDELLTALAEGHGRAPGRLDAHRRLGRTLRHLARELERSGEPTRARAIYALVAEHCPRQAVASRIRMAFTHEAEGAPHEALALLRATRASGPQRLTLHRSGRRLARSCRRSWGPLPPMPPLVERTVPLPAAGRKGSRPVFGTGEHVEQAACSLLADLGRQAVHGEGALWRHLFGLLFAVDTYFLPVGQLPAPYLPGPLDVGRPAFAERRPEAVARVLRSISEGRAPELVARCWEVHGGQRLAGVTWTTLESDLQLVRDLPPALLLAIVGVLLERGWRATRGLPDLLVLPGPEVVLPDAFPTRLGPGVSLVELKTPNDTLSDAQRWWLATLEPVVRVEVWKVRPVAAAHPTP